MIGDKLLQEPNTISEAISIHDELGLITPSNHLDKIDNAKRLVFINNGVYEKLHPDFFYIDATKQIISGSPTNINFDGNALCFEINGKILNEEEQNDLKSGLYNKNSPSTN